MTAGRLWPSIRLAGVMAGLLLSLPAVPAHAADVHLALSIALRWQMAGGQGAWTPYVVTVANQGEGAFTGEVSLLPVPDRTSLNAGYPTYSSPVTVERGGRRSLVFYVIDAANGYRATVRDADHRLVAQASVDSTPKAGSGLAMLSDLPQAEQRLAAPLRTLTEVDSALVRFPSAQAFPADAVYLSGLNGLVIDQFDSAALSEAQVQALHDFVGLGGTLIEAGGAAWRRTLLPLPADLVPLQPEATVTGSLAALADLGGLSDPGSAQLVSGQVHAGRVVLADADGTPLAVEAALGAGRVVELTFDPFGEPFDSQPSLAALAWSQAITRALSAVQGPGRPGYGYGYSFADPNQILPSAGPGIWSPGYGPGAEQLSEVLDDTRAAFSPPIGLLGGLLVVYVLLVGLVSYLGLKRLGRRGLMWATVPGMALVFTGAAYAVGVAIRGTDFLVTEVQVQRLGPGGAVETYSFDGVYAPRRGDVHLTLPANTLASTALSLIPPGGAPGQARITPGAQPEVDLQNVSIWSPRSLQALAVTHLAAGTGADAMPLEAHLRIAGGRLRGSLENHTGRTLQQLEVVSSAGTVAPLAAELEAGATLPVDSPFGPPGSPVQPLPAGLGSRPARPPAGPGVAGGSPEAERDGVLRLAASQALSSFGDRRGELALVGLTDPLDNLQVDGSRPSRSALAAVVEPLQPESADSLSALPPRTRLVSTFAVDGGSQLDVYDLELPAGIPPGLSLTYSALELPTVHSVEVFNWDSHSWRAIPDQSQAGSGPPGAALNPGETGRGVVRVRVRETQAYQADLALAAAS